MKLTDREVVEALQADTPLNRARKQFSNWSGKIEQAQQQRTPLSPIEMRCMEFEAVEAIEAALKEKPGE